MGLKILHVVRQFNPSVGGLENYVKNLAKHQQKKGHHCEILTLNRVFLQNPQQQLPAQEKRENIQITRLAYIGWRQFFIPQINFTALKKFNIVHVHSTDRFFDLFALLKPFYRWKLFATTHGGFFHTQELYWLKKIYFRVITFLACRSYDELFANSQGDQNIFFEIYPHIRLLPNAVEPLGRFLSKGNDWLYLGRLAPHKGLDKLIETFALLKRSKQNIFLHIAGPSWGISEADILKLIRPKGLQKSVRVHGCLPASQLRMIARQCGYYVSASQFEGFGMAMVEAMGVGMLPIVQSNPAFAELVAKAKVGLCIDYSKPDQAAEQIKKFILNTKPGDRQKAARFAATFSWSKLANKTLRAYQKARS